MLARQGGVTTCDKRVLQHYLHPIRDPGRILWLLRQLVVAEKWLRPPVVLPIFKSTHGCAPVRLRKNCQILRPPSRPLLRAGEQQMTPPFSYASESLALCTLPLFLSDLSWILYDWLRINLLVSHSIALNSLTSSKVNQRRREHAHG
jgi:hypothetical protein